MFWNVLRRHQLVFLLQTRCPETSVVNYQLTLQKNARRTITTSTFLWQPKTSLVNLFTSREMPVHINLSSTSSSSSVLNYQLTLQQNVRRTSTTSTLLWQPKTSLVNLFTSREMPVHTNLSSSSSSCSWRVRRVSCSLILKMKLVPPSLPPSSCVPSSFWFIL